MRAFHAKSWLITVSVACLLSTARAEAKDFLWRVRSPTATVYLMGSVHLLRSTDYPLSTSFELAYRAAEQVAFEIDLDEASSPNQIEYLSGKAVYPTGQTIRSSLNVPSYQKLQSFAVSHNQLKSVFDPYRPWYASLVITSWHSQDAGLQGSLGVDQHYFDAAKAGKKTRVYLETPRFQTDLLSGAPESEYAAAMINQIETGKQELVALVDAWKGGDLGGIEQRVEKSLTTSPKIFQRVFVDRNTSFVADIEGFLRQSKTTLVIVGAGHYVGSDGILARLKTKNIEVLQLPGTPPSVASIKLVHLRSSGEQTTFTESQETIILEENTGFTISADVSGDGVFETRWLKDGQLLPGVDNLALSKDSLTSADSGSYQVSVQSEFGTVTSGPLKIKVEATSSPFLKIQRLGGGIALTVNGVINSNYRIEYADNVASGPWKFLQNLSLDSTQGIVDVPLPSQNRFYRATVIEGDVAPTPGSTSPETIWTQRLAGAGENVGLRVANDEAGNSFVAGIFSQSIVFGETTFLTAGGNDVFIAKCDSAGNVMWLNQLGSVENDDVGGIATDTNGDCYSTGFLSISNGTNPFVVKYNGDGSLVWSKEVEASGGGQSRGVAVDADGNVLVAGFFAKGTIDFDGIELSNSGGNDLFLAKYDPTGNRIWASGFGGSDTTVPHGIAVDGLGNSFVTGQFSGTLVIGDTTIFRTRGMDNFIAKFDSDGRGIWAKSAGGGGSTIIGGGIAVNGVGDCYITGTFKGLISFEGTTFEENGFSDLFVAKYDSRGVFQWARTAGGDYFTYGLGIALDASGNCYVTGISEDGASFGAIHPTGSGAFVAKCDDVGNFLWVKVGEGSSSGGRGISVDRNGGISVTGSFMGSVTFDGQNLDNRGDEKANSDAFLLKLREP